MLPSDHLLDTNILLRFFPIAGTSYPDVQRAVKSLLLEGARLFYSSQNVSEFWNVCTRPMPMNGLGMTVEEANLLLKEVEGACFLAPDSKAVHHEWRNLILAHRVSGAQVHDARIVATMRVNRISHLLTLNARDFRRYSEITASAPADLLTR